MGSVHGLSVVHSADEPAGTFNVQRPTFNGKHSTINLSTINRFMGSVHGLWSMHNAHEPAGTFNVQRSTSNGKPSTINLLTINRFMGSTLTGLRPVCVASNFEVQSDTQSAKNRFLQPVRIVEHRNELLRSFHGLSSVHHAHEPGGRRS
jgi:hypothetical protein